jgi:hypothetical protein
VVHAQLSLLREFIVDVVVVVDLAASVHAAASLARVVGLTVKVESLSDAVRSLGAASPDV